MQACRTCWFATFPPKSTPPSCSGPPTPASRAAVPPRRTDQAGDASPSARSRPRSTVPRSGREPLGGRIASHRGRRPARRAPSLVIVVDASVVANVVGDDTTTVRRHEHGSRRSPISALPTLSTSRPSVYCVADGSPVAWPLTGSSTERCCSSLLPLERHVGAETDSPGRRAAIERHGVRRRCTWRWPSSIGCTLLTGDTRLAAAADVRCPVEVLRAACASATTCRRIRQPSTSAAAAAAAWACWPGIKWA